MKIIITGAAGSLGRAFVRHLKDTATLICVDNNEWAVAEFRHEFPDVRIALIDYEDVKASADAVIHCAAYKHVDLAESNPAAVIENNVGKYMQFLKNMRSKKLLFISTDKAVEPMSTYGYTKALGEKLTWYYKGQVARLGNIMNSSGSVIPVWEKAIKDKKPIKVTSENMKRYLIEEDDAVKQIIEQFVEGKKLIIPEMGEPKKIMDIVSEVLAKHGYKKGSDYEPGIEIIGIRPGEKLEEKLRWDDESTDNRG